MRHESRIAETDGGTELEGSTVGTPDGRIVGVGNSEAHPPSTTAARIARIAPTVRRPVALLVAMARSSPAVTHAFVRARPTQAQVQTNMGAVVRLPASRAAAPQAKPGGSWSITDRDTRLAPQRRQAEERCRGVDRGRECVPGPFEPCGHDRVPPPTGGPGRPSLARCGRGDRAVEADEEAAPAIRGGRMTGADGTGSPQASGQTSSLEPACSCRHQQIGSDRRPANPRRGQRRVRRGRDRPAGYQAGRSHEGESGADTRIRTEDLLFTKQLLYR